MINYSIVMRSVNANLFEINQAKSRINAAKKNGQTPAQADLDMVATERQNAYAIAQYTDVITIEKFAKHIADHGCVYGRGDVSAILYLAVDCMREQLLEGKKVRLGDLGDFSVSLQSRGAESADKFSAQNITAVNVTWEPGTQFRNLQQDAEFNLVASRAAQAAILKAIKAGKEIADTDAPVTPGGTTTPGTNPGSGTTDAKKKVTLQASPSNGGTVTGSGSYDVGQSIEIKAVPASGYTFLRWSDGNTNATRTVTISADLTLQAIFNQTSGDGGGLSA